MLVWALYTEPLTSNDLKYFMTALKHIYNNYGGLEAVFLNKEKELYRPLFINLNVFSLNWSISHELKSM